MTAIMVAPWLKQAKYPLGALDNIAVHTRDQKNA